MYIYAYKEYLEYFINAIAKNSKIVNIGCTFSVIELILVDTYYLGT